MRDGFPQYTIGERLADGAIHIIGVTVSLVAATALITFAIQQEIMITNRVLAGDLILR